MIPTILFSILFLYLLADIYLWYRIVRFCSTPWKYFHWLPLAIITVLICMILLGHVSTWMFSAVIFLFLLVIIPRCFHAIFAFLCLPRLGGVVRMALVCTMFIGITFGWKHLVVREIPIVSSRIPNSFNGYRIAHISDLHLGTYSGSPEMVERIVEMINEAKPDLIVFTGDIVNSSPEELSPFAESLSCLHAPDGILSILGNHDYCTYGPHRSHEEISDKHQDIIHMQKKMGWYLMQNENTIFHRASDSIAVIGVEYSGHGPEYGRADVPKAMTNIHEDTYKILLTHNPSHWHEAILEHTNIDLTLSGHTHAMHLKIFGWSPSALLFSHWGGLYKQGEQYLYVNTGTGSNIPFRLGAWPEISIITLSNVDAN